MITATYKPKPGDPTETVVARVHFKAGEPVEIIDEIAARVPALIETLRANPWFEVVDELPPAEPDPTERE